MHPPAVGQQQGSAAVGIEVVDPAGLAVAGARVMVKNLAGGWSAELRTGGEGITAVAPPHTGSYLILVEADGLTPHSERILWTGHALKLRIALQLAPFAEAVTVTSASRVEELRLESPVKVDVVDRNWMQATGYERVSDVLNEIPGVVTRSGASGAVASEQIRGISARQVAVLQDGLPIVGARGIKRGDINLNRQSLGRLDRVEVVKGVASALFGTDALGGVINMITREPQRPLEANLNLSGGSLGMFDARADIGGRWKSLTAFLDLEHHRQGDYTLIPGSPFTVGPEWRRNDLFFKTRYWVSPRAAFGFSASGYQNRETGRSAGETGPYRGRSQDSTQNYALIADLFLETVTTLQLRAYGARYDESSRLEPFAGGDISTANLNERYHRLDATFARQWGSRQLLQAGYEWVQNKYRGVNRLVGDNAGQQITANDVWLQDRLTWTPRIKLDFGGRLTRHSLFGTAVVPKAGLVVRLSEQWTLRGSFGRGFRAPDLGQLYFRFANPASFYQVIGNPNLRPETSRTFSAGVEFRQGRFRGAVNLFRNDMNNLIDSVSLGMLRSTAQLATVMQQYRIPASFQPLVNRLTFLYLNFGAIYTQGFEVDVQQELTRQLRLQGGYAWLDARDKRTGLTLPQRHKHQGFFRTDYASRRLGLWANMRGTLFSDWLLAPAGTRGFGYALWDFYLAKDLRSGIQNYFAIDNVANSRDRKLRQTNPTFDRADFGRTWRVGLRWRLRGE
jgi:outer membrane receptor for ferrienterochelin and colicins